MLDKMEARAVSKTERIEGGDHFVANSNYIILDQGVVMVEFLNIERGKIIHSHSTLKTFPKGEKEMRTLSESFAVI